MTAKDLKNALLQEAVQGKLVPQIASEGNARDLLEEIRKERGESLPLAPARKRSSATPSAGSNAARNARFAPITEDEIPFEIPENWCWCRLGEIVQLTSGQDLQPEMYNSSQKGIPYITGASNFNNGNVIINRWTETPKSVAIKDDLLLTCKGTVGEMAFLNEKKVHIARQVMSIRSSEKISLGYVKIYLTTQIENLKSKAKSMIPGIAREDVISSLIPLPPLAEQKRIVAAIEKFMPLIEEYGKKETELKAFNEQIGTLTKKAILQEAVQGKLVPQISAEGNAKDLLEEIKKEKAKLIKEGKIKKEKPLPEITEDEIPFDIPENWCWCRLGEIVQLTSGQDLQPEMYNSSQKGIPYITGASNFNNGNVIINRWTETPKSVAIKDDLLLTCKGTVGEMAFLNEKKVHIARQVMSIRSSEKISLGYVKIYLTTQIENLKSKAKSMIPGIAREDVISSLIPLPPLAEQKRIVAAIEKMLTLCEKLGEN